MSPKKTQMTTRPRRKAPRASFHRCSPWRVGGALAAAAAFSLQAGAQPVRPVQALLPPRSELILDRLVEQFPALAAPVDRRWYIPLPGKSRTASAAEAEEDAASPPALRDGGRFEIPAGTLRSVLAAFEAATGIRVEVDAEGILDLSSPGVRGELTVERALATILQGTGVEYRFTGERIARLSLRPIEESVDVTARQRQASPKYTEPLVNTPQSVTVISEKVLEEQGATTLRDALRNVTGISIQAGEGGVPPGDNLSIRGFNARTDLFVDGVRDVGTYSRDSFNLEQVEVAKGPASAYVGRGSTGGAVNLVSKTPHLEAVQSGSVGVGTDDYGRATLDVNQPLEGVRGGSLRINAMWSSGDTPGRDQVEDERWGIAPSLSFGLGTPTRLTVSYFHLQQEGVPDYGIPWVPAGNEPLAELADQPAPVDFDNFYGLVERDYEKTRTSVATAEVEHDVNDSVTLRNLTRWGETYRDSVITAPRFISSETTDIRRTDWKSRDQTDSILANQADLVAEFQTGGLRHHLVTGVEAAFESSVNYDREETGPEPGVTDLFHPNPFDPYEGSIERTGARSDADARSAAIYAFDTVEISERWQVSGGVRWDRFDLEYETDDGELFERDDSAVTWRAGVVYKPAPNGSIYAGAGTSFNPSAEELRITSSTAEVEPERSRSYEVGTKWELFGSRASLTAAVFQTDKTNARTPGIDPDDPPTVLEGEQRVRGFEVGLSGRISDRWYAWLGYTAMDSEVLESNDPRDLGNEFGNTPDHSLSLWTTYRLPAGFEIGAGAQFVGDRYNNARGTRLAPSYWLYNAMVSYRVNERFTLRLNADNLADEDYVDRVGGGHFVPGRGRSVALTTTFSH